MCHLVATRDLAKLYHVETKRINEAVKYNMEKFPEYNITCAYELGPGRVLTGLINRANVGCLAYATDNIKNVRAMLVDLENKFSR